MYTPVYHLLENVVAVLSLCAPYASNIVTSYGYIEK